MKIAFKLKIPFPFLKEQFGLFFKTVFKIGNLEEEYEEEEEIEVHAHSEISHALDHDDIEDKMHEEEEDMPQMGFMATAERLEKEHLKSKT